MADLIDNHVHIGRFESVYYSAETVFSVLQKAGVSACLYSSTTSGSPVSSQAGALQLYRKIREEITDAQKNAAHIGIEAYPLYWVLPAVHRLLPEFTIQKAMEELPYAGFKLHPRANVWDISDAFTRVLAESVFIYADKKKLPVLIHTGYDQDRADLFEPFFKLCTNGKIILAHCRPLDTVLRLLAEYDNVFCDTAFVCAETVGKIKAAGFIHKILFGSDFPITGYFNNAGADRKASPCEEDLYAEYVKNIATAAAAAVNILRI